MHVYPLELTVYRNVSFRYPGSEQYALQNISFKLSAGQLCVIVGANGSGKSTILKLVSRLYDPEDGQILLDGHDIRTLKLFDLRQAISVLFQDYTHFPLSIRDNIALGDPSNFRNDAHVEAAARLGGASGFIEKLPDGYDTYIERPVRDYFSGIPEGTKTLFGRSIDYSAVRVAGGMAARTGGTTLSGGQMQRLAVSRTFMRSVVSEDAKVGLLLFDEPSASLDPTAEHDLFARLRELRGNKTMVFSSHRFGNLTRHADLILYMNDSVIVEAGTHDELIKRQGEYARIWMLQAQAFLIVPMSYARHATRLRLFGVVLVGSGQIMVIDIVRESVDSVSELLSVLREHLNSFAPVYRLPPELLSLVFAMATYIPHRHEDMFNFIEDKQHFEYTCARLLSSGVTAITHVCKRWRAVALQTPGLWTYISASPGSDQFRTLSFIGPRLRRLDLAIDGYEEQDVDPSILRIDAPYMRCATLMCSPDYFSAEVDVEVSEEVQWVELFGQRVSSLEALALALPTNWLPSNTFNQLTHLLLSCNPDTISTSSTGLLTLLANAPRPEFLHVINLWYSGNDGITVALDHLRSSRLQISAKSPLRDHLLQWDDCSRSDIMTRIGLCLPGVLSLSTLTSLRLSLDSDVALYSLLPCLPKVSDLELHGTGRVFRAETTRDVLRLVDSDGFLRALSSFTIILHGSFNQEKFLLTSVGRMLSVRARMKPPSPACLTVHVQLRDRALDPASKTAWTDFLRTNFAPYVEKLELRKVDTPVPRLLQQPKQWMVEGAEKYWTLYDRAKPEYLATEAVEGHWISYDRVTPKALGPYGWDSSETWIVLYLDEVPYVMHVNL
ncbi:hypothetical protein C8T65DRAFT_759402 [Cerioporus squamosus]|nr:hypothetical protein C8T65DRAFT_759402 [Cerioporus squamosus]